MARAISILFICLVSTLALAQSYSSQVVGLFSSNERGIWVKQFEGLADDINRVQIVLGHTDLVYKGLFMEKGLPKYWLEGDVNLDRLQLLVLDSNQSVVGYIQGQIQDSTISGDWNFVNGNVNKKIRLERTLRLTGDVDCGQNKWIKTFTGRFLDDVSRIFLKKEELGELFGLLYLVEKNTSYTLKGKCKNLDCLEANITIESSKGIVLGQMSWTDIGDNMKQAALDDNSVFLFKEKDNYPIICGSQIVKDVQLSYVFPQLKNADFDPWLKSQVNDWLISFDNVEEHENSDIIEYQYWVDIDYVGSKLISGMLNFDSPNGQLNRKSFIYDLDKGEQINFDDWIAKEEVFGTFVKNAIVKEKKREVAKESPASIEWYKKTNYTYPAIRREGICFHSDFSRIHGERRIIFPWAVVQDYLKRPGQILKKLN